MEHRLTKGKIDEQVLYKLLVEESRSQKAAAAYFHVTEAAISKRVKAMNLNLTRHVGLERAKEVAQHGLDVVNQLQQVNRVIQDELAWAVGEARKLGADRKGLQAVVIDLTSEVRKQLHLQVDIIRLVYDLKAAAEFQHEVLDAIGQVSPEARQAIIERLHERRAVRSALVLPHAGR